MDTVVKSDRFRIDLAIPELIDEMLDYLPQHLFHSSETKFLDPAYAGGQFLYAVAKRLLKNGHSQENILGRLYGVEYRPIYANSYKIRGLLGAHLQIISTLDQAKEVFHNMKFDAVVGNPPFQDSSNESSYTNLWSKIYSKSFDNLLKDDGYLAMITPKTWATPKQEGRQSQTSSVQKIISEHAIAVNIDECSTHFPNIGSSFSYSVVSKKPYKGKVELTTLSGTIKVSDFDTLVTRMPKIVDNISVGIFAKVFSKQMFQKEVATTPKGAMIHNRDSNDKNKKKYAFPVRYSAGTIKWCDRENNFQYDKKVLFPNQTTHNYPIFDDGEMAPPNRGAVYLVKSSKQGRNFVDYCKSPLMEFIISQQRFHHGMLNTNVISSIPEIDLSKKLTNQEIYDHFGLSEKEIKYVEDAIK